MSFDLVLINAPLQNESGIELALDAAGAGSSVIMLIKSESCDEIAPARGGLGSAGSAQTLKPRFILSGASSHKRVQAPSLCGLKARMSVYRKKLQK